MLLYPSLPRKRERERESSSLDSSPTCRSEMWATEICLEKLNLCFRSDEEYLAVRLVTARQFERITYGVVKPRLSTREPPMPVLWIISYDRKHDRRPISFLLACH